MRQKHRDLLLLVGVATGVYSLYQLRRIERTAGGALAMLTADPTSLDALKRRALDHLLDLPFDFLKP